MPFTFKLSKRLAQMRSALVLAVATAVVQCDAADRFVSDPSAPSRPSFATSTALPALVADLVASQVEPVQLHDLLCRGEVVDPDAAEMVAGKVEPSE